MKEFQGFEAFAVQLIAVDMMIKKNLENGLEKVLSLVEKTAKEEIGTYQPAIGEFPDWPELADSTKQDRVNKGFSENDPLLRTGELRDSYSHTRDGMKEGEVGSNSDIAVYQELGTVTIPPRPVLGMALLRNENQIKKILGGAVVTGVLGNEIQMVGYD